MRTLTLSSGTGSAVRAWAEGREGDDEGYTERLREAINQDLNGDVKYVDLGRPEQVLHEALYGVLQKAHHEAETCITESRDMAYMILEKVAEPKDGEGVSLSEQEADLLRWMAVRWLDRYGRNRLKETGWSDGPG